MLRYLLVDFKVMMRIPIAVFFSLAFPLLMMVVIMVSYGNIDIGGGLHLIDKYLLVALGIGVLPLTLISFPIWIANRIEDGSLKRLTFLGVRASYMIASDIIVHIAMGILTFLLCFICAAVLWPAHTEYDRVFLVSFTLFDDTCHVPADWSSPSAVLSKPASSDAPWPDHHVLPVFVLWGLWALC